MVQPKNRRLVTESRKIADLDLGQDRTASEFAAALAPPFALLRSNKDGKFHLGDYGTISPATYTTSASMQSGSNVLSVPGTPFQTSDQGKTVGVRGAGYIDTDNTVANDGVLVGKIVAISGGDALLDVNAANSCSGVPAVWGTPIDAALANAVAAATAAGGGTVVFPRGRWIAVVPRPFGTRISFSGASRANTIMHVVKVVSSATDLNTAPWLRTSGLSTSTERYDEINLTDFTVDGSFFACSGGYGADMKMLHIAGTINSTVERITSINNPSTALGYDASINCLLTNLKFVNPGRLAKPVATTGSPGGSGIGIAVGDAGGDISMTIRDVWIKGMWTADGGSGRAGINIEMSKDNIQDQWAGGIHINGVYIESMFNGIVDSGGLSTIIQGAQIRKCNNGIRIGTNGIQTGAMGRDTIVLGSVIEQGISGKLPDGSTVTSSGLVITSSGAARDTRGRTLVADSIIRRIAGPGVVINGSTAELPVQNVTLRGLGIRENGHNGIQLSGTLKDIAITDNDISRNGQLLDTANSRNAAIRVASGTDWGRIRFQGNDYNDTQTTPTQDNAIRYTGAVTQSGPIKIEDNTGDQPAKSITKSSTTTINNTEVSTDVSAFALALDSYSAYEFSALIEYSTSAAAGLQIKWVVPTDTSLQWTVTGAGAPDVGMLGATNTANLAGNSALRVVRISGKLGVGATAGSIKLTCRQVTATASDTVITTKTSMIARKLLDTLT